MALTLEQYADNYLPTRNHVWPIPPTPVPKKKANPHLEKLPIKCILWTAYGTLLNILQGELLFEHPQGFVTENALDKTIKEFNMWNSMSRKPGAPAEYMKEMYNKSYTTFKLVGTAGEKHPEVVAEKIWDDIVKKLLQKDYKFDVGIYGALNEYVKKIAYFYHASIQGCGAYPGAADTVRLFADRGVVNGLLADGQCFTPAQLHKAFRVDDPDFDVNVFFPANLRILSAEKHAKKPSDTLFKAAVAAIQARKLTPDQVLHVGSSLARDIAPAKRHGFRTALFVGDKNSLAATAEELKEPAFRPDILVTELPQLLDVLG
jgi:FMN phosphatase YigB (HAD superfamily)